jgi:hypothetical protein
MKVTLFYRDGGNYKYTADFEISDVYKGRLKKGEEIMYTEIGISEAEFHEQIGSAYDPEIDHTFVTIEEIHVSAEPEPATKSVPDIEQDDDDNSDMLNQGIRLNRTLLGNLIQNYIKENNTTITALAEASGVSREQIGWLITGRRDPRMNTLLRVLVAMRYILTAEVE